MSVQDHIPQVRTATADLLLQAVLRSLAENPPPKTPGVTIRLPVLGIERTGAELFLRVPQMRLEMPLGGTIVMQIMAGDRMLFEHGEPVEPRAVFSTDGIIPMRVSTT